MKQRPSRPGFVGVIFVRKPNNLIKPPRSSMVFVQMYNCRAGQDSNSIYGSNDVHTTFPSSYVGLVCLPTMLLPDIIHVFPYSTYQ
jgi:hypothetical protein